MRRFVRFLGRLDDVLEFVMKRGATAAIRHWKTLAAVALLAALVPPAAGQLARLKQQGKVLVPQPLIPPVPVARTHADGYHAQLRANAVYIMAGGGTTRENFHRRWYLADNFSKFQIEHGVRPSMTPTELVSVRISFYRDPGEACRRLDALIVRAVL